MRRGGGYGFRGQRNFRNEGRTSYDSGRNEGERNCDESPEPREDRPRRGGRPPWRRGRAYERERNSDESPAPREDRPRRGGLPPGLKGKEIGLYFRDRARRKKVAAARLGVSLDPKKEQQIRELLDSTKGLNSLFKDKSQESSPCTRYFSFSYMKSELKEEPEETITHNSGTDNNVVKNDDGGDFIKLEVKKEESPLDSDLEILPGPSEVKSENSIEDRYSHLGDSSFKRKFLQNISGSIETNLERSLLVNHKLVREEQLDKSFKEELLSKQNSFHYQKMAEFRAKLPSFKMQHQLLKLIEQNQVVVISGETGCGKTTQVAQFILDDYIMENKGSTCHIVCTQPRRISATSVAMRVADERDEVCGETSVGYQIRLERKLPRQRGSILFCTTGILLQRMQTDPALREISHLVLDEIHERDVHCDFVLTILKDVIIKRPDLKIILMSATLNAEQFAKYFGNCPCINIPGYTFPVKEYYLEDAFEMTGYVINTSQKTGGTGRVWKKYTKFGKLKAQKVEAHRDLIEPYIRQLESEGKYSWETLEMLKDPESEEINLEFVAALIHHICRKKSEGAILVFLPGWDNISTLHKIMTESGRFHPSHCLIIPLHSMMPTVVQRSVFDRPPAGIRKIIIATNIAETSITIDDVVYVIDCGKIKLKNFDVENNISTLKPEWVSLANARQRKGRAGRVQPGECYHLYTKAREMSLANYPLPEMLRTRLEEVILQIKILQLGKVKPFLQKVMDPPDPRAVDLSVKLLENLNALDSEENLTPLGFHLANLPVDPQTGKMILMGALFSCVDPIFSVAASLSFKDAFHIPLGQEEKVNQKKKELSRGEKSDHLVLVEALRQWEEAEEMRRGRDFCWEYFLSSNTLSMLRDMKGQFAEHLQGMNFLSSTDPKAADSNINSHNISLVKAIICAGLYPNVAIVRKIIRKRGEVFVKLHTPEDGTVCIHPRSINEKQPKFESPFLLYHMKLKSTNIYLHDTTMVYPLPLLFFGKGVDVRIEDGHEIIAVDNAVGFKCERKTANLVKELRKRLDQLLEYKITHPGTINWKHSTESAVLKAIIELITSEDNDMMLVAREDNFSD